MSSRRRFLSSTVAVAGSAGLPPAAEAAAPVPYFPLMRRGAYDYEAVMGVVTIQARNKLCFLSDATLNGLPGTERPVVIRLANDNDTVSNGAVPDRSTSRFFNETMLCVCARKTYNSES
jgi:hypothetical protein